MHAKQFKRAKKVMRSVKYYLGCVVRDIERNAKEMSEGVKRELIYCSPFKNLLNVLKEQKALFAKILLSILERVFAKNPLPLLR